MNGVVQAGVMTAALMHSPHLDASGALSLLNGAGYVVLMIWLGYSVARNRHLLLAGIISGLFGASFLVSVVLVVAFDFPLFLLFFFLAYGAMLTPASVLVLIQLLENSKKKTHHEAGGE
jgi:hypothetical protein